MSRFESILLQYRHMKFYKKSKALRGYEGFLIRSMV